MSLITPDAADAAYAPPSSHHLSSLGSAYAPRVSAQSAVTMGEDAACLAKMPAAAFHANHVYACLPLPAQQPSHVRHQFSTRQNRCWQSGILPRLFTRCAYAAPAVRPSQRVPCYAFATVLVAASAMRRVARRTACPLVGRPPGRWRGEGGGGKGMCAVMEVEVVGRKVSPGIPPV